MSTVGEAIKKLNELTHEKNFHVTMVNMDLIPEGTNEENNTPYELMYQTYDWRYAGKVKGHGLPDKDTVFHVDLTADNMAYIGRALEVYNRLYFEVHMKPILDYMIKEKGDSESE